MFDITSSKLLILGVVALIVIGPKDLPALLRTIGKYVGIIKRQAAEFRAQFEEAMRESELDQLKSQVETLGSDAEAHMRAAEQSITTELSATSESLNSAPATDANKAAEAAPVELSTPAAPPNGATNPDPAQTPNSTAQSAAAAESPMRAREESGV